MYPEPIQTEILSIVPDRNGETGAECEIILPDYCPNILRILQTNVTIARKTCTVTADRLTVEGSAEFRVLYWAEDGSGLSSVTQQTPFSCSMDIKHTDAESFDVKISPSSCSARALTSQKIYARCTLQICLHQDETVLLPTLSDLMNYECKRASCTAATLRCTAEKPLRISDEFENDSVYMAASICDCRISFRETEQKPLTDKLIVKADMLVDLLCKTENGTLFPLQQSIPVSQILDLPGLGENPLCSVEFDLQYFTPSLQEQPNGKQVVLYDTEIRVSGRAYGEIQAEWTEDAYSAKKILEHSKTVFTVNKIIAVKESGSVRETVEIGTCTAIQQVSVAPTWKRLFYQEESDTIVCEGSWICKALISDGEGTQTALQREIPFLLQVPSEGCTDPLRNDTQLLLSDLSWNLADASHLELRGSYFWNGMIISQQRAEAITQISEKQDRPQCEDTVTLYYATAGESLWEIAKEHACPYQEMMRLNEISADKLDTDKMLLILSN